MLLGRAMSCGTSRYASTCCATRLNVGAATCPPSCAPVGESSCTRIVTAGRLLGGKPPQKAEKWRAGFGARAPTDFYAEAVFSDEVEPASRAFLPGPLRRTAS